MRITKSIVSLLLLSGVPAWANVVLHLDAPNQNALPGATITFTGYIVNNYSAIVDLNNIDVTLSGMFLPDTNPFYAVTAPFSVAASPGATVDYAWFSVTVANPYTAPFGVVSGTVSILGGVEGPGGYDPTAQTLLGSTGFWVNVTPPVSAPDPSTWSLIMIGGILLGFGRWRLTRRRAWSLQTVGHSPVWRQSMRRLRLRLLPDHAPVSRKQDADGRLFVDRLHSPRQQRSHRQCADLPAFTGFFV